VTYLVAVLAFLVPILSVWTPLVLAPLLAGAALVSVPLLRWRRGIWPVFPLAGLIFFAMVCVWSGISLVWTIDLSDASQKLGRLVLLLAMGFAYIACVRCITDTRIVPRALVAGVVLAIAFMLVEKFAGAPVYRLFHGELPAVPWPEFLNRLNRGMTVIAILVWPAAHAAFRLHRFAGPAMFFAAGFAAVQLNTDAAVMALLFGAIGYGLVWLLPTYRVATAIGCLAALSVLLMPAVIDRLPAMSSQTTIKESLPESAYHRLLIWKFSQDRIAERPVLGWGFNGSRSIPGGKLEVDKNMTGLPLHPHNAALQWRLELGLPGAVLGGLAILFLFRTAGRYSDRTERAMVVATIIAAMTIACLSYGIWQSWWVAALIFAGGALPPLSRDGARAEFNR